MLRVLLYSEIEDDVNYGCQELLTHIGVPYFRISDFKLVENGGLRSWILLLPESSRLNPDAVETIRNFEGLSLISTSLQEDFVEKVFECRIEKKNTCSPPKISGFLDVGGLEIPFFHDFFTLKSVSDDWVHHSARGGVPAVFSNERGNAIAIVPQLFRSTTYILSGGEKPSLGTRWLNLSYGHETPIGNSSEIVGKRCMNVPIVNVYEEILFGLFTDFAGKKGVPLIQKWLYPKNYDMALCLTHDVEAISNLSLGLQAFSDLRRGRFEKGIAKFLLTALHILGKYFHCTIIWELLPSDVYNTLLKHNPKWNFETYMEIERDFGARSSFYFLLNSSNADSDYDFDSKPIREMIRFLIRAGWEVGLHGSFCSFDNKYKLAKEKKMLERALGRKVSGIRQHRLRMDIPATWTFQEEAGLIYDTSFGYVDVAGFRFGSVFPFKAFDGRTGRRLSILEIPLTIIDGDLFGNEQYMNLDPKEAIGMSNELVETGRRYHGALTLLWHVTEDIHRYPFWTSTYRRIIEHAAQLNTWFTSGEELAKYCNVREQVFFSRYLRDDRSIKFHVVSPRDVEDFSFRIFLPTVSVREHTINNKMIPKRNVMVNDRGFIRFFANLQEGENIIALQAK